MLGPVRMNQMASGISLPGVKPSDQLARVVHWLATGLALASFLVVLLTLLVPLRLPGKPGWPEALLLLAATLTSVVALSRQLPLQNVLLAAGVIALIGGGIHAVGAATDIPFGPFSYTDNTGPRFFNTLAWPMPAVWVVAILNSRGVARLMLRPWRKVRNYGFWLMGITIALAVLFDAALEPFAASVKHYWLWHPTRLPLSWCGAPVTNFLGWFVTALLIMAFASPALIDKRQRRSAHRPPDYHPLVVWLLAVSLFAVGAATRQLWLPVGYCALVGLTVAVFAIRGGRW